MKVLIISCSVRKGRNSHRVSKFFQRSIQERTELTSEIFDLKEANFPIFEERLSYLEDPHPGALDFAEKVNSADSFIFVCPEYNGGYPAAFKNAFDLLYAEWKGKPVGIASISTGAFGGSQVTVQIQSTVTKVGMIPLGAVFPVPKVSAAFDEEGNALEERTSERGSKFLDALAEMTRKSIA
ncbi:MAG: NAD(P)H-dependent oxidoreductase [Flavobacteriales bacterium]|nr:NAD(P)H-dependent oxidoreductase [Flavobacteriales bacterium]